MHFFWIFDLTSLTRHVVCLFSFIRSEYATSVDNIANTVYDLFNRKLFSLPKILLLPGVMARQPLLVIQVFPFIMLTDWVKASAVSFMTTKIEHLQEELQHWRAIRTKVESFDLKNAELLHRSGSHSLPFTRKRWEALTNQVQNRLVVMELLQRSKGFFAFIHRNFVFSVLVDCALANLIAVGKIVSTEIFVFSRAMEDAVDLLLMRSRSEAELARMATDLERLAQVRDLWKNQESSTALLACTVSPPGCIDPVHAHRAPHVVLRNLHYSRGTAQVRADHVELAPGVYALTGRFNVWEVVRQNSSSLTIFCLSPPTSLFRSKRFWKVHTFSRFDELPVQLETD